MYFDARVPPSIKVFSANTTSLPLPSTGHPLAQQPLTSGKHAPGQESENEAKIVVNPTASLSNWVMDRSRL